ncbi:MAG: AAA family ATPase, partial [Lentisphaeria bacterium]|nr:AAA family ATPase [Lentisphaeria bacterium]
MNDVINQNQPDDMPAQNTPGKPFNKMAFLYRRGFLIAVAGTLILAILAPTAYLESSARYESKGIMQVKPEKEPTISGRENSVIPGDFRDYLRTQAHRIRTYRICELTLNELPQDKWPAFLDTEKDIKVNVFELMSRLEANEITRSLLFEISLEAGNPDGLAEILNALMVIYLRELNLEQGRQFANRLKYLQAERDRIKQSTEQLRLQLVRLSKDLNNKEFLHNSNISHLKKVAELIEHYIEAETDKLKKEAFLHEVKQHSLVIKKESVLPLASIRIADNYGINRMELLTYGELQNLRAGIDGLTKDNPDRQYIEKRMLNMGKYLTEYRRQVKKNMIYNLNKEREYQLNNMEIKAQASYDASSIRSAQLKEQLDSAKKEANRVSEAIFHAADITQRIDRGWERIAILNTRIYDTELLARSPLPVQVDQMARAPYKSSGSNFKKLIVAVFILSYGLVICFCLCFDLLDNRIRQRHDLEYAVGGAVPGTIAKLNKEALAETPPESARELAVRLRYQCHEHGCKTILFTGVGNGCGTSTISKWVAESLADYGEKVLLISLSEKLAEKNIKPSECNQKRTISIHNGLYRMQAYYGYGLGLSAKLESTLQEVTVDYSFILIDSPPMLKADITENMMRISDAVVIVAKEDSSLYCHLNELIKRIKKSNISALTAILNFSKYRPVDSIQQKISTA